MDLWHLTLSSVDRRPLFPEEGPRRNAVRQLVRLCGEDLLLFCLVDDHGHVVIVCAPRRVPVIRMILTQALARACGRPLLSHATPVETRAHLTRLVRYLLRQTAHHGLDVHPAWWSGSCFQDLIGARCIAALPQRLARELPRLTRSELYRMVGLETPLDPAPDEMVRDAGPKGLVRAATAALALGPQLDGRSAPIVLARRASAHLAEAVGIPRVALARTLRLTTQRVGQLLGGDVEARLLRAARMQVALEDRLRADGARGVAV